MLVPFNRIEMDRMYRKSFLEYANHRMNLQTDDDGGHGKDGGEEDRIEDVCCCVKCIYRVPKITVSLRRNTLT